MPLPRYAARRDSNEPAVRADLADAGWLTEPFSKKDWPDLFCAKGGRVVLWERKVKRPTAEGGSHGLSEGQKACHNLLRIFGVNVVVAETAEQFLRAVGDLH